MALIVLALGISMMARTETQIARNYGDVSRCKWAARTGIYSTIQQLMTVTGQTSTYLGEEPYTVTSDEQSLDLGGYTFGAVVEDEAGKINLNDASSDALTNLFGSSDTAGYILAWRGSSVTTSGTAVDNGNDYYSTLSPPYQCKGAPFETVKELQLIEGVTATTMSSPPAIGDSGRPLSEFLTVYDPVTPAQSGGSPKVNIQTVSATVLQSDFSTVLTTQDATAIVNYRNSLPSRRFASAAQVVNVPNLARTKVEQIYDRLTIGGTAPKGLINVNAAPVEVLAVQTGMDLATAQAIVDYRSANGAFSGVGYLLAVSSVTNDVFMSLAPMCTVTSNVFKITSTGQLPSTGASATVTCVIELDSGGQKVRYWQE
jgi:type II secretory pathway component PulK